MPAEPENVGASTLRQAMARIMGQGPTLSPEQSATGANVYTSSLAPTAYGANPVQDTEAALSQEGGVYDPQAKSREIQKEQLKFSNFAMEETARQRAADLAYQQQMANLQSQSQAESARMMQDQMNMQNQLLNQQSSLAQPIPRHEAPQQYAYNPATVAQTAWNPQNVIRSAPAPQVRSTSSMNSAQAYGTNQIYPGQR